MSDTRRRAMEEQRRVLREAMEFYGIDPAQYMADPVPHPTLWPTPTEAKRVALELGADGIYRPKQP